MSSILDRMTIRGKITAKLYDALGHLIWYDEVHNLVTDVGDQYSAKKVAAVAVTAMAGMKLGTATTAAAKNGAGAFVAVADYVSGSAVAWDATFPKIGASLNIAQFQVTWAAGVATNATINRVGIVDNTTNAGEADATHTFSMAVFSGAVNKAAADTFVVTWNVTFLGA